MRKKPPKNTEWKRLVEKVRRAKPHLTFGGALKEASKQYRKPEKNKKSNKNKT